MKTIGIFLIIMSLLLSSLAVADFSTDVTTFSNDLTGKELTGVAGSMLKNERVNVYIKEGEKTWTLGLVTESRKVVSLKEEELTNPTLKVFSDMETVTSIQNSATPADDLKKALEDGKITYEAVGFFNKIKFGFSNFFVKMFGSSKEDKKELKNETKEDKKEPVKEKETKTEEKPVEKVENKTTEENEPKVGEEKKTDLEPVVDTPVDTAKTYTVNLEAKGFDPVTLKIKKGDTVEWKVTRNGNLHQAMILGTQNCVGVKSKILTTGESYKWKFDTATTCTVVDGITTTQTSKITVE
ncbi:MAG: hypothetical protein WCV90_08545 [Candidatus Woesearchaeota archaeon]|jgi:plastocyanin